MSDFACKTEIILSLEPGRFLLLVCLPFLILSVPYKVDFSMFYVRREPDTISETY
jgi:hypothetical protein